MSPSASQIKSQMLTHFSGWHTHWALNKLIVRWVASFLVTDNRQTSTRLATFTERDTVPEGVRRELQTTCTVRKRLMAICLPARYFQNLFLWGQTNLCKVEWIPRCLRYEHTSEEWELMFTFNDTSSWRVYFKVHGRGIANENWCRTSKDNVDASKTYNTRIFTSWGQTNEECNITNEKYVKSKKTQTLNKYKYE